MCLHAVFRNSRAYVTVYSCIRQQAPVDAACGRCTGACKFELGATLYTYLQRLLWSITKLLRNRGWPGVHAWCKISWCLQQVQQKRFAERFDRFTYFIVPKPSSKPLETRGICSKAPCKILIRLHCPARFNSPDTISKIVYLLGNINQVSRVSLQHKCLTLQSCK